MKRKLTAVILSAMLLYPAPMLFSQSGAPEGYLRAVELYDRGMFERAESLFGDVFSSTGDIMAKGYVALCAVRLQENGSETLAANYVSEHPYSKLVPQIHFYNALNLFDNQDYKGAVREFAQVSGKSLYGGQVAEWSFKQSYSFFEEGELDAAERGFRKVEKMPQSDYTAPSRYSLAYILYSRKDFSEAYDWFEKASKDPRFTDISKYYMLECRFMRKDYNYVVKNGTEAFDSVPKERQAHLARIISESYLALGDTEKAKFYYEKIAKSRGDMDRDDFFYSGSILYAVDDFKGAIDNYSLMTDRTDSIGQIANYQLGYSYIQTGNKVAAMDAFKSASDRSFNPDIQEDAHFNYAKLSFDLNHNPSVFNDYIAKYSAKGKGDRIYSYMALASLYNHDYAGAVEAYSNIDLLDQDQKANYMRANYLRANQLIGNGSWSDAVPFLKAASFYSKKSDTFNQLSRYWLGESYYRSDQFDKAVETFTDLYNNSALEGKPEGKLVPYDLAYSYFRSGNYDNAAKWFDKYLEARNPAEGEDAASRRADCDFIKKDYPTAVKEYESAARRFAYKDNLYPYYRAGIAYGLMGGSDKKINVLSRSLKASPSAEYYSESMYELGRAFVSAERNDEAVSCFKKLRSNTKDKSISAKSLIELGMISRNISEYDQAIGYYKQVISEAPGTEYAEDALLAIESICQSQGRTDEYLDYADQIGANKDKTDSEKEDMYFNAAEQIFLSDNYSKALVSLQNYLERYPDGGKSAQADFYVAECYRNLGKKEQACEWYRKSISKEEASSFSEIAMLNFSKLSYELQRYKDAFGGYSSLYKDAVIENNRHTAQVGMMMSAFKDQQYTSAVSCAEKLKLDKKSSSEEILQADYIRAKSNLSLGNREKAFEIFTQLSSKPSTSEGAEAAYMIIQDAYDQGDYDTVETKVYKFSDTAGGQAYWLAKAFIVLGDSFAEKDNYAQAKATFESILNGYQPSEGTQDDVLDNVRMRLGKLKNLSKEQ